MASGLTGSLVRCISQMTQLIMELYLHVLLKIINQTQCFIVWLKIIIAGLYLLRTIHLEMFIFKI